MIYLDTSAAVKALVDEEGSDVVLRAFADGVEFVSSQLLAVELHAVADRRAVDHDAVQDLLERVAKISLGDATMIRAIELRTGLRALDALHLATALEIGDTVSGILTFDREFAAAAARHGLPAADLN